MRLLNKGARKITHAEGVAEAGKPFAVTDKVGKYLKKLYPSELISLDDMLQEASKLEDTAESA